MEVATNFGSTVDVVEAPGLEHSEEEDESLVVEREDFEGVVKLELFSQYVVAIASIVYAQAVGNGRWLMSGFAGIGS